MIKKRQPSEYSNGRPLVFLASKKYAVKARMQPRFKSNKEISIQKKACRNDPAGSQK